MVPLKNFACGGLSLRPESQVIDKNTMYKIELQNFLKSWGRVDGVGRVLTLLPGIYISKLSDL
jgi:hypothetical protein